METPRSVCRGDTRQDDDAARDPSMVGFAMAGVVLMMVVRVGVMYFSWDGDAGGIAV